MWEGGNGFDPEIRLSRRRLLTGGRFVEVLDAELEARNRESNARLEL